MFSFANGKTFNIQVLWNHSGKYFWVPQDHQTWYILLDAGQGYNHAKFKRPPLNNFPPKANVKVFVESENKSIISLEYVQKWKNMVYSLSTWFTQQSYKVST